MMRFCKIILDPETKYPIITEDIALVDAKHPIYVLADKYKVFRLRIFESDFYDEKLLGFVIVGHEHLSERIVVFLTLSREQNLIIKARMQKKAAMEDKEKAILLLMALLVRLRDKEGYVFNHNVLPSINK